MASRKLETISLSEMNNFEKICKPLIQFIKNTWNTDGLAPMDWDHRDSQDKELRRLQIDREAKALESFNGPDTSTAGAYSAEERLQRHMVKYDVDEQGRTPLESLVSACIAYGMVVEQERQLRYYLFNYKMVKYQIKKTLNQVAKWCVPRSRRNKFKKDASFSFELASGVTYPTDWHWFHWKVSPSEVAKWDGKFDEYIAHYEEELTKIRVNMSDIVESMKNKKKKG